MKAFTSILLPLDGSAIAARALGCTIWLADRLGATVHVLRAAPRPLPPAKALEELRVPEAHRARITLHQASTDPARAVLDAIGAHAVDLVVMSARGESAEADADLVTLVGHVARAVIEESAVPIVLLPAGYREALPWRSILVPTSGEVAADEALVAAVRLAHVLGIRVQVAHCADHGGDDAAGAALSSYADAPHHEYPRRLQEMLDRAVACSPGEECGRIEEVLLCRGEVAREILELVDRRGTSLLALGWHGNFATGHAAVVKRLLGAVACPLLLVRPPARAPFALRVGEALAQPSARGDPR